MLQNGVLLEEQVPSFKSIPDVSAFGEISGNYSTLLVEKYF